MIQFYFLSIFFNVVIGYLLLRGDDETMNVSSKISLQDETVRLILGILSVVTGVLKILSPVQGDIPIIGDILPALAGVACGLSLIFEYYAKRAGADTGTETGFNVALLKNKKVVGVAALAAAALHFLFPQALLL
jgi:uncharacterized membrane-anchored protein